MTKTVLLGDICLQITDGTHSTVKDNIDGEYLLLSAKNIKDRIVTSSNERKIDKETLESLRKRTKTAKNDVLVTSVGTIGETAIIQDNEPNYEFQRSVLILKPDTSLVNPQYLYYCMRMLKSQFISMATGAVQKCLFIGQMKSVQIELPDLETQKKIADILGTIDEKIELNRQMNETLEQTGQALFRHYFIDNPEAEKWGEKSLSEQLEILSGGTPKTSEKSYWDGDIPWFSVVDAPSGSNLFTIQTTKNITEAGLKKSAAKLIPKHTTIISARGTVGKLAIAGREMTINQSCYALKSDTPFYSYLMIDRCLLDIKARVHGSVFDTITRNTFDQLKFTAPPSNIITDFENRVEPLFLQILRNVEEIQTLTTLRDTLLPRLINGKVKV